MKLKIVGIRLVNYCLYDFVETTNFSKDKIQFEM